MTVFAHWKRLAGAAALCTLMAFNPAQSADLTDVDGAALLENPPAEGSAAFAADQVFYQYGLTLRNTPRGRLAAEDADLVSLDSFDRRYSAVTGYRLSKSETPRTRLAMQAAMGPILESMKSAKKKFMRPRPFSVHEGDATCRPDQKPHLNPRMSYPSGHSVRAWGYALVLSSLIPQKAETILREGLQETESRWICGAHWMSDTKAGRILASAAFAKLTADPAFLKLLEDARRELSEQAARRAR
ncbi:MAG: phosphatase PAP2 family protein [Mesosutterella sp.]|nr:phosphatase PAP2 family protein [Mesosutterella sp.]